MKPTSLPAHADNIEQFCFTDLPGPATLTQIPVRRCDTCQGIGMMAELTCPECDGRGATIPHSTKVALEFAKQAEQHMMAETLTKKITQAMKAGEPRVADLLDVLTRDTELEPDHLPCYTAGLILAVRMLLAKYLEQESHGPAILLLQRELAGYWRHGADAPDA